MPLNYEWTFLEEIDEEMEESDVVNNRIAINEVFDILPLSGTLLPEEAEQVEFIFNAISG
jgi:hypothetical protein